MLAIPSPDLVFNLFASAGQVLGVLMVLLGGAAIARKGDARRIGAKRGGPRWVTATLAVLLVATGVAFLLDHLAWVDADVRRLRTNLTRPSLEAGRKVVDVDLRTMKWSDQLAHPRAVDTAMLASWIAEGRGPDGPLNLVDIREPEEIETGQIAGSWDRRFPDLYENQEGLVVPGKTTVMLCDSGNRSSELCDAFRDMGITETRFMTGGYEKWTAEGRPLAHAKSNRQEIRDIPDYPTKWTLLDTAEAQRLVDEEGAVFVDVRYPKEFEQWHIDGALNLTLRKQKKDEILTAIEGLPKKPIIAVCYDKRSSFFGMLLGLRVHRAKGDFRGRYMVPHEWVVMGKERPHVAQWQRDQEGKTLLREASAPLVAGVQGLGTALGSLALVIGLAVLAVRLLVLPLTAKADRDQFAMKSLAGEIRSTRERLGRDPVRARRAIIALYRRERLTPGRNVLALLVQLALFLVLFGVVDQAAEGSGEGLLWIQKLGEPDPAHVLPALIGALCVALIAASGERWTWKRFAGGLAFGGVMAALTFSLKAAVDLYLVANLTLVLVQSRVVRARLRRANEGHSHRAHGSAAPVLPLAEACCVPGAGNKAMRLARMKRAGLPVPDGFVVLDGADAKSLAPSWRRLAAERVAVRSSGCNEDGTDRSYAGVFDSILHVDRDALPSAIEQVRASLASSRAAVYSNGRSETGAVLVQRMVPGPFAGVLFTEDPSASGCMLVELVEGLGDALVSGKVTPRAFRFTRGSGRRLTSDESPVDLAPLLDLGRRVETLFGSPQDIEWSFADGQFHLLQARDITRTARSGSGRDAAIERERHRLLAIANGARTGEIVFAQSELTELLPEPTPFSLALMESLWAAGGSTDLACRELGVPYEVEEDSSPLAVSVFGRLYVHRREERRRTRRALPLRASFRLASRAERLEAEWREEHLPRFLRESRRRDALELARLATSDLLDLFAEWHRAFLEESYVAAERINIAADVAWKAASAQLRRRGLDPGVYLAELPETVVHQAYLRLTAGGDLERSVQEFLELFGHRAPHDFELAEPRFREVPAEVEAMASRIRESSSHASKPDRRPAPDPPGRLLGVAVARARRFQALKEEAKHYALRDLAGLRLLVLEIGRRHAMSETIFDCLPEEILAFGDERALRDARERAHARRLERASFRDIELPAELTVADVETVGLRATAPTNPGVDDGALRGIKVAGDHEVVGEARVVRGSVDVDTFLPGEVLVARFTDPTFLPLFPRARGIVTEVGGWLSHAAIQARESNIPAVVGARGALHAIHTGDVIHLASDGTVRKVANRRVSSRHRVDLAVDVNVRGARVTARLRDLSRRGAGLVETSLLREGDDVEIGLPEVELAVRGKVVRVDGRGCGIDFESAIPERTFASLAPASAS
ncbi:MAG TPA: PEP/pyruvate-binding domain-containing protein [Planctomycetota bacterium]|nr:PEP/pyruvate-binding domain-containing protein [Planctomycetota bacterium]